MNSKKIFLPIKILLSWIILTYILFILGPYDYNLENKILFYSYLFFVVVFLYLGYKHGIKKSGRLLYLNIRKKKLVFISISTGFIFNLFLFFSNISKYKSLFNFSFGDIYSSYITTTEVSLSNYIYIFISPLIFISISCGFYFWSEYKIFYKVAILFNILFSILTSIATGTRSGLISILVYFISIIILKIVKGEINFNFRQKVKYSCIILLIVFSILSYSNRLVESREGFALINPLTLEEPNSNNLIFLITPDDKKLLVSSICFYYSHSYYRLNQAMAYPFLGIGLGFSNSYFVMNNFEKITGSTYLKDISYSYRLDRDTGNGMFGVYWATLFTWFASDFTFPGTLLFIYFIAYIFGRVTKDILVEDNPIAITFFSLIFTFIFSFPTNNPLQDGSGLFGYFIIMLAWFFLTKVKPTYS